MRGLLLLLLRNIMLRLWRNDEIRKRGGGRSNRGNRKMPKEGGRGAVVVLLIPVTEIDEWVIMV